MWWEGRMDGDEEGLLVFHPTFDEDGATWKFGVHSLEIPTTITRSA